VFSISVPEQYIINLNDNGERVVFMCYFANFFVNRIKNSPEAVKALASYRNFLTFFTVYFQKAG
jgi:hypothetical protein